LHIIPGSKRNNIFENTDLSLKPTYDRRQKLRYKISSEKPEIVISQIGFEVYTYGASDYR
jgi:hypothetical protein